LVFYSEASGFYKYYQAVIEYLLSHSTIVIHYVTNDPNDQVFELAKTQHKIKPYYIGQKRLITLMMKMDADMVVMTTPDLDNFYIKRSYIRKDVEYVYIPHAIGSTHLTTNEGCYDHYDSVLCTGQFQIQELRESERVYETPKKNLIPYGFGLLDNLIAQYEKMQTNQVENSKKRILIAPSWQKDNILDSCLDQILSALLGKGYLIIVRPHPEYKKRYVAKMNAMIERYKDVSRDELIIETDFSSNVTIFTADLVVTDWSAISCEFSFSTLKPTLFINTPMKIMNKNYKKIELEPLEFSLRKQIGIEIELDHLNRVADVVAELFSKQNEFHDRIRQVRQETFFNIGHSGEAGGKYIIQRIIEKDRLRKQGES
jgi:YidC/Oxa1 family membrane protein insertase